MEKQKHECDGLVWDHTGYHSHKCGRPAKWEILGDPPRYRCGIHARKFFAQDKRKLVKEGI